MSSVEKQIPRRSPPRKDNSDEIIRYGPEEPLFDSERDWHFELDNLRVMISSSEITLFGAG
jgi:hypothetical protein